MTQIHGVKSLPVANARHRKSARSAPHERLCAIVPNNPDG